MDTIEYRKATPQDLKLLFELAKEFHEYYISSGGVQEEFFPEGWKDNFEQEITSSLSDDNSITFLAVDTSKPVGYITTFYSKRDWFCVIEELFVKKDYRKLKVGKQLLELSLDWCKQFDCPVRLEVFDWNTGAIDFYTKLGFKKTSVVLEKRE